MRITHPAKPGLNFDPNTILQTQDFLSQDYESLRALAEVMFLVQEMFIKPLGLDCVPPSQRQSTLPSRSPCYS